MKRVKNKETGVEEVQFGAVLISLSEQVLTNVNKKDYKVATIEFEDINGNVQRSSAIVYAGNYDHGMEIGGFYLATATPTDQGVIVKVSHLVYGGERATPDMFGLDEVTETTTETAGIKANTAFIEH